MPPEYFFPLLGFAFAAFWGVIGTGKWYLRERLKAQEQGGRGLGDEAADRIAGLEHRVAELEERLDFTERVLAREREQGHLPGGAS